MENPNLNDGYELTKFTDGGQYTLVWLKDTPKYDDRVQLPSINEIIRAHSDLLNELLGDKY